ncbi:MAG TPA: diacylglycerol kinase family protein [Terriglobales bacterium]|jgi:YegS/Rv2252/BmrU family lipid kinase|nr:diacylglycerol kinase family protein [Terriglobales bacterium]
MRKAALLYNARSGGRRSQRDADLQAVLNILRGAGVEANLVMTQSSADAAEQARKAIAEGCDTVFACGGDGTIHDVLQAMASTRLALGVIPMGTANALAHDLGLPLEPAEAARAALQAEHRRIALGRVQACDFDGNAVTRYFTVAVGIGVDAHLFYKLNTGVKQRFGMAAYYAQAWYLWFTHRMSRFAVEIGDGGNGSSARRCAGATEMLAVRIRDFGGVVRKLAPGASLDRNDMRVVVCRTSSRLSYLLYVTRGLLGAGWNVPGVELVHSERVRCDYLPGVGPGASKNHSCVYVEVDGELVGKLPAEITMVPDALTLLAPKRGQD